MICSGSHSTHVVGNKAVVRDQRPRDPAYYCGLGRLPPSPPPVTVDFWKQLADFRTARLGSQGPEHGAQWPFQPCLKSCSDQLSEGPLHPREPPHACCRNQKPVARKEGSLQKKKKRISPIFPPALGTGLNRYPFSRVWPYSFWHFCCVLCNTLDAGSHHRDGNSSRQEHLLRARYSLPG